MFSPIQLTDLSYYGTMAYPTIALKIIRLYQVLAALNQTKTKSDPIIPTTGGKHLSRLPANLMERLRPELERREKITIPAKLRCSFGLSHCEVTLNYSKNEY
jgi:hypothetical protein